ncbi:hypothetical protein G3R49_01740 [Shewanella sp. WXL01]|uniref:hypothetical protein n=1 Tax=Shewanella sp. WXL01 TaxID=2709721 RepID=UPI001438523E|nr:hypothetical protein [Shewanella sp. WXL01]NKF49301.1 hypothetical protein [Shewanella sp. WXL01]
MVFAVLVDDYHKADVLFDIYRDFYENNGIIRSKGHILDFVVQLYARARGKQECHSVEGFKYKEIIENWDVEVDELYQEYVELLLNDQVAQVVSPPSKFFYEFSNLNWRFVPYSVLMLMKLRQDNNLSAPPNSPSSL